MDELRTRNRIIGEARRKYIPAETRNISTAVRLYLDHLQRTKGTPANKLPAGQITRKTKPKNWVDKMGRPKCPKCRTKLGLRLVTTPKGKSNLKGYKFCWECERCGYEKYMVRIEGIE